MTIWNAFFLKIILYLNVISDNICDKVIKRIHEFYSHITQSIYNSKVQYIEEGKYQKYVIKINFISCNTFSCAKLIFYLLKDY